MLNQPTPSSEQKLSRNQRRLAKKQAKNKTASVAASTEIEQQLNQAIQAENSGELELATTLYVKLIEAHPKASALQLQAGIYFERQRMTDLAFATLKNAVTLDPTAPENWFWLGEHLSRTSQHEAAVIAHQHAVKTRPHDPELILYLAKAYAANGDAQPALATIENALALRPDHPPSHYEKGLYLISLGEFQQSHQAFYKVLELDPNWLAVYFHLSHYGAEIENIDDVILKLKERISSPDIDSKEQQGYLFSIAKLESKRRNHDEAFGYYQRANAHVFNNGNYNVDLIVDGLKHYRNAYSSDIFKTQSATASNTELPVFIVGMPRSGTTLVEQVIASHTQATTAGELNKISILTDNLVAASATSAPYPSNISQLNPAALREMGAEYIDYLHRQHPGNWQRIIDKMPFNFVFIGLIKVLFPNAAIIHCKRDPLDTCISNFETFFGPSATLGYSYDLETLGKFYRAYEQMMAHWHTVLPGQIMDVAYEDMVTNKETTSRKIIDHINLDWEPDCLEFHQNRGGVKTASAWQVRQPLYTSSIGRWQRYEKHLEPLINALKPN